MTSIFIAISGQSWCCSSFIYSLFPMKVLFARFAYPEWNLLFSGAFQKCLLGSSWDIHCEGHCCPRYMSWFWKSHAFVKIVLPSTSIGWTWGWKGGATESDFYCLLCIIVMWVVRYGLSIHLFSPFLQNCFIGSLYLSKQSWTAGQCCKQWDALQRHVLTEQGGMASNWNRAGLIRF